MSDPVTVAMERSRPWGLKWRCSVWFITSVVALGITTDLLVYSLIVPIVPFRLEALNYSGVSALVGWLLFTYSTGIVVFTPPIAFLSERYNDRQILLLCGQVALMGTQVMFMVAPTYWLMVVARLLQGISSSVIWVAGLALLCDTVPEKIVGRQLGIAMSGGTVGYLVGPSAAGALYNAFGFRAPFYLGISVTFLDFIGRLLIIERKHAIQWGVDPTIAGDDAPAGETTDVEQGDRDPEKLGGAPNTEVHDANEPRFDAPAAGVRNGDEVSVIEVVPANAQNGRATENPVDTTNSSKRNQVGFFTVIRALLASSRTLSVCVCTLIYGMVLTSEEPAIPLHLQAVWSLDSTQVGLVFIAAVIPTIFSSAVAGWWVDKNGTTIITVVASTLSLPFFGLQVLQNSLPLFIVFFALANFIYSMIISPLTAELATVTRGLDGVGYAHVYGAFNMAYGVGSALGPTIGGQMYDHIGRGWMAICFFDIGITSLSICLSFSFFGDSPLLSQLLKKLRRIHSDELETNHEAPVTD